MRRLPNKIRAAVTNYNYDQWLRIWTLGGEARPVRSRGRWQSKFDSKSAYKELVEAVFKESARALSPDAAVLVRTDAREFTRETTKHALRIAFPDKRIQEVIQPDQKKHPNSAVWGSVPKARRDRYSASLNTSTAANLMSAG